MPVLGSPQPLSGSQSHLGLLPSPAAKPQQGRGPARDNSEKLVQATPMLYCYRTEEYPLQLGHQTPIQSSLPCFHLPSLGA